MNRFDEVRRWRDALRAADPRPHRGPLSPAGARLALDVALDALSDDVLARVAAMDGEPWESAAMAVARTVLTAPIEWAAVLLGRGTRLVLKHPRGEPGLVPLLVECARGLPLTATDDRAALRGPELVVAMGSDPSVAEIGASTTARRALLFGARFSVAWVRDPAAVARIAEDAALHDGRGCFSPAAVFTPLPLAEAVDALAAGMADAERAVPRGEVGAWEAARLRDRRALARVVGRVAEGAGWAVHGLPAERFSPVSLPRAPAVHSVPDADALRAVLAPYAPALSSVATDDPALELPGKRVVAPGLLQRPVVERHHDGVDWLRACLRS